MEYEIRNDTYINLNIKEMRITKIDGSMVIISNDPDDLKNGFQREDYYSNYFTKVMTFADFKKRIEDGEIKEIYQIRSHAIYKKQKVEVNGKGKTVRISTDRGAVAEVCGMEMVERAYYTKVVPVSELKIIEEKKVLGIDDL